MLHAIYTSVPCNVIQSFEIVSKWDINTAMFSILNLLTSFI